MEKINEKGKKIGIVIIIIGVVFTLSMFIFLPSESKYAGLLMILGAVISTVGVYFFTKQFEKEKKFYINFGVLATLVVLIFFMDFVDIQKNNHPPRFATKTETTADMVVYKTPFFKVYRIHPGIRNEYYVVDQKEEYTKDTIPISEFDRLKSGIDKIINYRDKFVGDNTNDGNLISHLPLSEYGYTFEIDSTNFGLTINYRTKWNEEELYMKKALIYNAVSTFALIENIQYLKLNFEETSYIIDRQKIEETYPNYSEIVKDNIINKDNFNKYVEDMMKDDEFVKETFKSIFG